MEGGRKRSKGGFFNLFDWNGKSRKKLFSNNSESSEGSRQGKGTPENISTLWPDMIEVDDRRANSSNRGSSDLSCASSVTSEETCGSKAPGVVARLMGLDSLPTSSVAELSSTSFSDSCFPQASKYDTSTSNLWSEYNHMDYLNIDTKREKSSWNSVESRLNKVQTRPFERFQTEALPPKSAKSIPITHHKLSSPINSPAFVSKKNVAYIVEAAAKIMEASPRATANGKVPLIGNSSLPLRIRDLKQKMEAAHTESKPLRSRKMCSTKNMKVQHSDRRQGGFEGKVEGIEKGISNGLRNKGKLAPLVAQVKANAQKGEGSISRSNSIMKQKDQNEFKSNHLLKRQPDAQNTTRKRTSEIRTINVLRQNNRKQNSVSNRDYSTSTSKNSVLDQQSRKTHPMSGFVRPSRTANKVVGRSETMSRKVGLEPIHSENDKMRNVSQKKQCVGGDIKKDGKVSHNTSFDKDDRSIKCNVAIEGSMNGPSHSRKTGMDIVSFTFTSPIKKAMPDPHLSSEALRECNSSSTNLFGSNERLHFKSSPSYLPGLNVIGGDALGVLLEQKLKELANKVDSSHCNMVIDETSSSSVYSLQSSESMLNGISTTPAGQDRMFHIARSKDETDNHKDSDWFSVEDSQFSEDQKFQDMEEHSSSSYYGETGKECEYQLPSPVSILEPSFASGSSSNTNGSKHCSPAQAEDVFGGISANESRGLDDEEELSDSACSISTVDVVRMDIIRTSPSAEVQSDWEIGYVRDILNNAEPNLEDFALGHSPNLITQDLFHHLENQESRTDGNDEENLKLERKVLFDCISECMDLKCGQILVGSCKAWARLDILFGSRGWVAEELYKVILGWRGMGDLMVDELVDRDMSTQHGRWVDFNIEAFEEGAEIEKGIVTSLVDELVSDLFVSLKSLKKASLPFKPCLSRKIC